MEFFRRLRFVWAIACLIATAVCFVAYLGLPRPQTIFFGLAALTLGLAPYLQISWLGRVSVAWLGAGGALALANSWGGGPELFAVSLGFVAISFVVCTSTLWVLSGLRKKN